MGPIEQRIEEVADALKVRFDTIVGEADGQLQRVLTYEPMEAPTTPLLTMMFAGYNRAGLETPTVEGQRIIDPLGGREWVFHFDIRIWVDLVGDEQLAQKRMNALVPQVVAALEADKSLGGFAVDSAMPSGLTNIMSPNQGQALLIHTCKCSVEIEESV